MVGASIETPGTCAFNMYTLPISQQCECGKVGACTKPQFSCNCNGDKRRSGVDYLRIDDKSKLPLSRVDLTGAGTIDSKNKVYLQLGPLKCGPRPFGECIHIYTKR